MPALKRLSAAVIAAAITVFATGGAMAQQSGRHSLGGFLGLTDRNDTDVTFGLEYEYAYDALWSFGGIMEYTPDAYGPNEATLLLATGNFHPSPRLKLTGGIGAEFNDFNDRFRLRAGIGFDAIEGPFTVTPRAAVDFGEGDENIVLGATVSHRF